MYATKQIWVVVLGWSILMRNVYEEVGQLWLKIRTGSQTLSRSLLVLNKPAYT